MGTERDMTELAADGEPPTTPPSPPTTPSNSPTASVNPPAPRKRPPTTPRWTGLHEAVLDLAALVTGPVFDPHGVDAVVELAAFPCDGLRRRLAVVGAVDGEDVAQVLCWASLYGLAVAIPGTGHLGSPEWPTVVVTTTRADRIVVDPDGRTVRAGVGATWSGVRRAAARQGRCLAAGPGLAIGGRVSHRHAAVRSVVLVDGDGEIRRVPPREADRGAGVVVEVELVI